VTPAGRPIDAAGRPDPAKSARPRDARRLAYLGPWIAESLRTHAPTARTESRKEQGLEKKIETVEEALEKGNTTEADADEPGIVEDICVEELAIDGICGVY
jgi:mycofactocin precursor